jgi:hypothetical protein
MNDPTTYQFRQKYIAIGESRGAHTELERCIAALEDATGSDDSEAALLELIAQFQNRSEELAAAGQQPSAQAAASTPTGPQVAAAQELAAQLVGPRPGESQTSFAKRLIRDTGLAAHARVDDGAAVADALERLRGRPAHTG